MDHTSREQALAAKDKLKVHLAGAVEVNGIGVSKAGDGYVVKVNVTAEGVDVPADRLGCPSSVRRSEA